MSRSQHLRQAVARAEMGLTYLSMSSHTGSSGASPAAISSGLASRRGSKEDYKELNRIAHERQSQFDVARRPDVTACVRLCVAAGGTASASSIRRQTEGCSNTRSRAHCTERTSTLSMVERSQGSDSTVALSAQASECFVAMEQGGSSCDVRGGRA